MKYPQASDQMDVESRDITNTIRHALCAISVFHYRTGWFVLSPVWITHQVSGFYKYNSAAREFREVHSKTLGKTTDAVSMEPSRLRRPKSSAVQPAP